MPLHSSALLMGLGHAHHCELREKPLQVRVAAVQESCPHLTAVPARTLCSPQLRCVSSHISLA